MAPAYPVDRIDPSARLNTPEEVHNYLNFQLMRVVDSRERLSAPIGVADLRKAERVFLIRYGAALGNLAALVLTRKITDEVYAAYKGRLDATMLVSVSPG